MYLSKIILQLVWNDGRGNGRYVVFGWCVADARSSSGGFCCRQWWPVIYFVCETVFTPNIKLYCWPRTRGMERFKIESCAHTVYLCVLYGSQKSDYLPKQVNERVELYLCTLWAYMACYGVNFTFLHKFTTKYCQNYLQYLQNVSETGMIWTKSYLLNCIPTGETRNCILTKNLFYSYSSN
jgi:hypothetical protein